MSAGIDTALQLAATLTNDEVARMVQLAIEYDPHPPHGGIDWSTVDRDSFAGRVEGFAHQELGEHPKMLARVLGSPTWLHEAGPSAEARDGPVSAPTPGTVQPAVGPQRLG